MKAIATVTLLVCLSAIAPAGDLTTATPTPTPYLGALPRPHAARRIQQRNRRRAHEEGLELKAATREQAKANRRSTAAAQAQAREAARARERTQRQLDSEARREKAGETSRPTSDLMKRMGFSDQEIAAQKALEEPATATTSATPNPLKSAEQKRASASPAPGK